MASSSTATAAANPVKDDFPEALTYRYNDKSAWVPAAKTYEDAIELVIQEFPGLRDVYEPHLPDKLQQSLSCWIKNMNKLSSLIDRLHGLSSATPAEHQSQLLRQVMALRAMFKKQQERFIEFLELSEEFANKYLFDISAEIQQQSIVLNNLEERLEAAKKLREEAVDLQNFYESGTVATMKDLRASVISRPLPKDDPLFREVDIVMAEIRRIYEELNKFWKEEICHVAEALKKGRTDPRDLGRWKNFHSSIKQTIEFWKNRPPNGDAQTLHSNSPSSSTGVDLGEIASSLSPTIGSLEEALELVASTDSLRYAQLGRTSFQRVYVGFAGNRDLCLSFLRDCVDYGEKVFSWCIFSIGSPTSSRVGSPHDLQERTMRLRSEMTGVSVENATSVQGSRKFKATYNKVLALEKTMTSGLCTLLEELLSRFTVTDSHPDDALLDIITLERLHELWEKARYSVSAALATVKNEPAPPLASTRPSSVLKRFLMKFVCSS